MTFKKLQLVFLVVFINALCFGQKGAIILDSINSKSLGQTITQEDPVRKVAIYLPPGYANSSKRYPVLYLLHGIGDDHEEFTHDTIKNNNIQDLMDVGIAANKFGEMIIVMPNEKTNWFGSFYTNSSATGNWADFTAQELVNFIDAKFRTMASPRSRAIAGHSMGGYGALTLVMTHPDIFSVVYGMNAALVCFCGEITPGNPAVHKFVKAKTYKELLATQSSVSIGLLTVAQAFSPNPKRPPFFADYPFKMQGARAVMDTDAYNQWQAKDPVQMAKKYKGNLLKLEAIRFDSGSEDEYHFIVVNSRSFSKKLTELQIPHEFEEYNGDHRNRLWGKGGRIYNDLLPFIFEHLEK